MMTHEFNLQIYPTTLTNKNDLWAWLTRITHEFDPHKSREVIVMDPEEMKT